MLNFFVYILLTLFLGWIIQWVKLFDYVFENWFFELIRLNGFFRELRRCRICLNFWIAFGMYFIFGERTFTDIILLDAVLVAVLVDYIVYYVGEGIIRNHAITRI